MWLWRSSVRIAAVAALGVIPLLFLATGEHAAAESWRVENIKPGARLHLRKTPSSRSVIVGYIPSDTRQLESDKCVKRWCLITFGGNKGWAHRKYLAPDRTTPKPQIAENLPPLSGQKRIRPLKNDGRPIAVYSIPSKDMPVAGRLPADMKQVVNLGACLTGWCYISADNLSGWLPEEQFADDGTVASLNGAAGEDGNDSDDSKEINETLTTATQAQVQTAALSRIVKDIEGKHYTLAGLTGESSLPIRANPEENAQILGWIPYDASNVEGMKQCVEKWCLIRHGATDGWVLRRHLADDSVENSQRFQVDRVDLWGTLEVLDYPSKDAGVVGQIPSYATGIVPIGGCDKNWCHIRYLGIAGWVRGEFLAPQGRPNG